jgi:microcin C transport system substrate-binding protein
MRVMNKTTGSTRAWYWGSALIAALLCGAHGAHAQGASKPIVSTPPAAETPATPVTLPANIQWTTNNDDPPIGSTQALKGGTLRDAIGAYPLTFRLMGPNANDGFASWNRLFTMAFSLVSRHPVTDRFIPIMATHWSIQPDQKTIFFKLDRDARFSDGRPITAVDYVLTWRMMQSEHIIDPFYNNYAKRYYASVDRVDDYTLRVVGTRPSWRPLSDYGGLWPTPAHATVLDADWVKRTTNQVQLAPGPYVVSERVRGESVTFERLSTWWGDGKRYFQGLYNFERIHLRVISQERTLDYLRRGELDVMQVGSAKSWNEDFGFAAVKNGWVHRARVMVDRPSGISGLHMNVQAPIFQDKRVRQAMQHLFNFERINRNLMFNEYFRLVSFFEGSEYANPELRPYDFNPAKARALLAQAGWHRPPSLRTDSTWQRFWRGVQGLLFTRTDSDDVLVNQRGDKLSFTLVYGSKALERHLTVVQQDFRRAGVDMRLQLLEPGTAFERGLERKYEMTMTGRTSGFYPSPRQYLGTEFKHSTNNNNIWGFGTPHVDQLITMYEDEMDLPARQAAMHQVDRIVHDEAFYIPFWTAPYIRIAYWDYMRFPEFYLPKRSEQLTDYLVSWIDPQRQAALKQAMQNNTPFPVDTQIDKDFYKVRRPALRASP